MMNDFRILVIEQDQDWRGRFNDSLQPLMSNSHLDFVNTLDDAARHPRLKQYDLMVLDLASSNTQLDDPLAVHHRLFHELRGGLHNTCAVLLLSDHANTSLTSRLTRVYNVHEFVERQRFTPEEFLEVVRAALFSARVGQASAKVAACHRFILTFSEHHLLSSELISQERKSIYAVPRETGTFNAYELASRTDRNVSSLFTNKNSSDWREEARSIGERIRELLANEGHILSDLYAARKLPNRSDDLWLQFCGPAVGLATPFELLRDGDESLVLNHILTRKFTVNGASVSHKPEPFYRFLEEHWKHRRTLRVLIIGFDADGTNPSAEEEANELVPAMREDLERLGFVCEVKALIGNNAKYAAIREELEDGRYHILHYAGHGQFDEATPELSGLPLSNGDKQHILTAKDLFFLTNRTELRLVYLSSCASARSAVQPGRGDFYGMLDALVKADVPTIIGHRWPIKDTAAKDLAINFYKTLWRTFLPGLALLEARREIAMSPRGLDDDTWAAPILVEQNS